MIVGRFKLSLPLYATAALLLSLLAGCRGDVFLQSAGPSRDSIHDGPSLRVEDRGASGKLKYALITVTPAVSQWLEADDPMPSFTKLPLGTAVANVKIGIGDVVSVTIFESSAGGLFIPGDAGARPGNYVQLPNAQVDDAGTIAIPFAGKIRVSGLTPLEVQATIERALRNRALEPQVVVSVVDHRSNVISVVGDVGNSIRFNLDPGGERLLGAIARAGGSKFPAYESLVTVQRGAVSDSAMLSEIASNPRQNIQLQPGDSVYIAHLQRFYVAMGATGQGLTLGPVNRRLPFEDGHMNLVDAVGKAGGLSDSLANPQGLFLYRLEKKTRLQTMLPQTNMDEFPAVVPTIYIIDMSRPDGMFLGARVAMHDKDTIYASDAPAADLAKLLNLIVPSAASAANFNAGFR